MNLKLLDKVNFKFDCAKSTVSFSLYFSAIKTMVKRKLKTLEPGANFSKTNEPNDERKEKLAPFDFDRKDLPWPLTKKYIFRQIS